MPDFSMKQGTLFPTFDLDAKEREILGRLPFPKGIEMRVNRSCQVEGAFGMIKQDMGYVRFRRTSLEKARLEFMLYCLGLNIRKLFRFYGKKARLEYWKSPEGLKAESFKKPSVKRIENRMAKRGPKQINQPNEKAKREYEYAGRKKGRNATFFLTGGFVTVPSSVRNAKVRI